jgi:L-fuconolactonase
MEIIDAHLHGWDVDNPRFPWDSAIRNPSYIGSEAITAERLIGMMDAVGVAGALLTSPSNYGSDHSYAFDAATRFPGRFGVVGPIKHPTDPGVIDLVRSYRDRSDAVAIRLSFPDEKPPHWRASHHYDLETYRHILSAAQSENVPVLFWVASTRLAEMNEVARSFPDLQLVVDHLGMIPKAVPPTERLAHFPDLIALAEFENVAVKCTAAPSVSADPYPFRDLWPYLHRVFDAFGLERVMWGTDITKHMKHHTYAEELDYIRYTDELSASDKATLLGGALRRVLHWAPSAVALGTSA